MTLGILMGVRSAPVRNTQLDIFYQGDVCPTDRPNNCFPNSNPTQLCNDTNWDSRSTRQCYDTSKINVLEVILLNQGCSAGVFLTLQDISITIDGTSYPLENAGPLNKTTAECQAGSLKPKA